MRLLKASVEVLTPQEQIDIQLKLIEMAGRVCYKSEDRINRTSHFQFINNILNRGHEAVIEHGIITVKVICDRGVSHEIVRHRIGAYCQESTRYCNYSRDKFDGEVTFIDPYPGFEIENKGRRDKNPTDLMQYMVDEWISAMINAERSYKRLLEMGATPQMARSVLPNSTKTEIVITYNLREWRHFLQLRCAKNAHPQMREVALEALRVLHSKVPIIFDDLYDWFIADIPMGEGMKERQ